jgi:GTP-binding protein Era
MRSGFITLIGRPNAGKSTLLNVILGQKISIISAKPQTTRNRILGIHTTEDMQAVMIDTPGVHTAKGRLHRAMVQVAVDALSDADAVCWVLDASKMAQRADAKRPIIFKGEQAILRLLREANPKKLTVALNKVDLVKKPSLLPLLAAVQEELPDAILVPISARRKKGVDALLDVWKTQLPEAPMMYPEDQVTDVSQRFVVAELVREKLFRETHQEIPYATAVEIEQWTEEPSTQPGKPPRIEIMVRILVERSSQKGIVIGKGGSRLKKIGTAVRHELEKMLEARVFLALHVSVASEWTNNPRLLRELGYE